MENLVVIGLVLLGIKVVVDIVISFQIRERDRRHDEVFVKWREAYEKGLKDWQEWFSNDVNKRVDAVAPEQYNAIITIHEKARLAAEANLAVECQKVMRSDAEIRHLELQVKLKEKEEFKLKQLVKLKEIKNEEDHKEEEAKNLI